MKDLSAQESANPDMASAPTPAEVARIGLDPIALASELTLRFNQGTFGALPPDETYGAMLDLVRAANKGHVEDQRSMLLAQSIALNAIFIDLARRSSLAMNQSIDGAERLMRLALKAQGQCRTTIESIDRLANGREQVVRHIHVDNRGGQTMVAEHVHTRGAQDAELDKQSHARRQIAQDHSLPCEDEAGATVSQSRS